MLKPFQTGFWRKAYIPALLAAFWIVAGPVCATETLLQDLRWGEAQSEFKVYGRGGEPCDRCGTPIDKIRVAGRGTWYCPNCQRREGAQAARSSSSRPSRSRRQSSV